MLSMIKCLNEEKEEKKL